MDRRLRAGRTVGLTDPTTLRDPSERPPVRPTPRPPIRPSEPGCDTLPAAPFLVTTINGIESVARSLLRRTGQ